MTAQHSTDSGAVGFDGVSEWGRRWRRFQRNRLALVSLAFIVVLALLAVFAEVIAPFDPNQPDFGKRLTGPFTDGNLLGTDVLGRDVFSRLLFGLRTALFIALTAELLALLCALIVGVLAGYFGGRLDQLLMAATDVMYAFPTYLFAVILATVLGRSTWSIILAIAIGSWLTQARLVRAQMIKLKTFEYVEAGRSMGAGAGTLILRYLLPNSLGPILVATSFGIPAAMLAESGLAILGLGVAPPEASLGTMITEGYKYVLVQPNLILWPFTVFALGMLAFTWVGDGIRDAFDPKDD
ncbi:ABC transporter permease [Nocardioides sp. LHD-245]|uniref:ABC transporter permease n=1 Tax=Nocardioides sp. LHD-245 TaxID=3051387 RepID=UPI0027DF8BCE|nr:ABC transporter permease [Nocardioides sp. LHD-245]